MAAPVEEKRKNRLIVMVPENLAGNLDLTRKVYWMAIRDRCDVHYLALVDDEKNDFTVCRGLATMKAITAGDGLVIQSTLVQTRSWLNTIRAMAQPGDRIVCHQEQSVKTGFRKTMPVSEFLHGTLHLPCITIAGYYNPQRVQIHQWLRAFITWAGFLLIVFGFAVLETRLDNLVADVLQKVLFGIILLVEVGAIWAWDAFTG